MSENPSELKRTNSQIMRALQTTADDDDESVKTAPTQASGFGESSKSGAPEQRRGLPKVRSGVNIGANYVEKSSGQLQAKE